MTATNFLGLLDLKKDAAIGLDGQTIILRRDDFVGVSGLEPDFHLISVRTMPDSNIPVGFIMSGEANLVRRYDPQTEEVSSFSVDDVTTQNLVEQAQNGKFSHTSVIEYAKIVSPDQKGKWHEQTKYILPSGILEKRGIRTGDKIIPGSYEDDSSSLPLTNQYDQDGHSVTYPDIPVVDTAIPLCSNSHPGTKRYLLKLSPAERTQLFLEPRIANRLLVHVMSLYYGNNWRSLLGDLQLAYTLFLYLQCLASLEHWKDLIAMLSLVDPSGMRAHAELYAALLEVLPSQLSSMDQGFLEDVDEAGNNFLLPSLKGLCSNMMRAQTTDRQRMLEFECLLSNKFPSMMVLDEGEDDDMRERSRSSHFGVNGLDSDDESDGPIIVDIGEVEASLARSANARMPGANGHRDLPSVVIAHYPLLVAAILPHEDILMTCARALDEKSDVSLVRESAAYLEDFELQKF